MTNAKAAPNVVLRPAAVTIPKARPRLPSGLLAIHSDIFDNNQKGSCRKKTKVGKGTKERRPVVCVERKYNRVEVGG